MTTLSTQQAPRTIATIQPSMTETPSTSHWTSTDHGGTAAEDVTIVLTFVEGGV